MESCSVLLYCRLRFLLLCDNMERGKMARLIFEALIKSVTNKSLVSGDKATRVVLEFDSSKKTKELNILNGLHRADKLVKVAIVE